ncbi:MATE efflux family protein [Clostridium sp. DL-VIII]|uniref:MATE family efflux transporter n=1 Tax=Clostridium sp. DL-VIII TaxID=641107 RepID=UPI00023AF771|nr:MATE family efflux transporter [Clostridium sp. DL-VIII]EHI96845.1 MATE efflux family protein [Clostridium sp. DL-VIII]
MVRLLNKKYLKEINTIAIPVIFSNVSAILLGLVDQAIVGRISIYAYAGVGLVTTIINSLIGVLGNIAIGYNILGAKSNGAKDNNDINQKFNVTIVINIVIGLVLFLLIDIFSRTILNSFFGLDGQTLIEATNFLKVFSLTIGLNLILFTFSALFKIYKRTSNIFMVSIIINIINVLLDYILVFGKLGFPKLGSIGAATGTVASLLINVIIYYLLARKYVTLNFKVSNFIEECKNLITLSLPLMGQEVFQDLIFVCGINMIVSRIGIIELSTYTLLLNVINLLLMPMFAYSSTNMTLVSESLGKKDISNCNRITNLCLFMTLTIFLASFLFVAAFKNDIPALITSDSDLINSCNNYIIFAVGIQLFCILQTMYKFSLQSINLEKWVFKYSLGINIITVILFIILSFKLKLYGIYIGFLINYIVLTVVFYKKYRKEIMKLT